MAVLDDYQHVAGSPQAQALALRAALRDRALQAELPAVLAVGFGVLPIGRADGTLVLAGRPGLRDAALGVLRQILKRPFYFFFFEWPLLIQAILKRAGAQVNLPTFSAPDFLDDPELQPRLREAKVERLGPVGFRLARGRCFFLDVELENRLEALDRPRPLEFGPGQSTEPLFTLGAAGGRVFARAVTLAGQRIFVRRRVRRTGQELSTHFAEEAFRRLPVVFHPSEVQLVRVEADGMAVFHVYDREETARPAPGGDGPAGGPVWSTSYYFLQFGERYRREIRLRVRELRVLPRARLDIRPATRAERIAALPRCFGLEP